MLSMLTGLQPGSRSHQYVKFILGVNTVPFLKKIFDIRTDASKVSTRRVNHNSQRLNSFANSTVIDAPAE